MTSYVTSYFYELFDEIFDELCDELGPVQTSHFTCAEYNTYLRRLKLVISTFDSDVAYNCPAIKSFPDPDFVSRFFQNGGQE